MGPTLVQDKYKVYSTGLLCRNPSSVAVLIVGKGGALL